MYIFKNSYIKLMSKKLLFVLAFSLLALGGCTKGDIKDNYCGIHINYQYCKCAFHNEYCGAVGMSSKEAKDFVYDSYDAFRSGDDKEERQVECNDKNGALNGNSCYLCEQGETVKDNKCVAIEEEESEEEEGECKFDSDCDAMCEGDVAWKMGCNARTDTCEKTFDTDCSTDIEVFGNLDFSKVCGEGVCVRDTESINETRANLLGEKALWSNTVKEINGVRLEINQAMLDANKNCLNGLADMTNLAIVEFANRVGNILAGGIPDVAAMTASAAQKASGLLSESVKNLASAAVDYVGFGIEKLKAYEQGVPIEEEKKLKPHEYIKLNCDLYQYFKGVQAESDIDLEAALQEARDTDAMLQALP